MISSINYNKTLYTKEALLKAAFSFTNKAYIHIDVDNDNYIVTLKPKNENEIVTQDEFDNEILFQTVRIQIGKETKDIRQLLTARAMASTLIDHKESTAELEEGLSNENEILTNWFENENN